ncbi:hypothetical protein, partial [Alicyclobacillus acidoterrestris]|uniref:hypothetical protein n=1 Tax=Alicyclobacillus acidoterrestris TaxID=1450 RepID=UPI001F1BFC33
LDFANTLGIVDLSGLFRVLPSSKLCSEFPPPFALRHQKRTGESRLLTRIHPCCTEQLILLREELILRGEELHFANIPAGFLPPCPTYLSPLYPATKKHG